MLKRYMHKRERHLAMLNDNRTVRPFEWGLEFIGEDTGAEDPHVLFSEFSERTIKSSDEYFGVPSKHDFTLAAVSEPGGVATGFPGSIEGFRTSPGDPVATAPGSDSLAIAIAPGSDNSPPAAGGTDSSPQIL